jgi:hypothetical protein
MQLLLSNFHKCDYRLTTPQFQHQHRHQNQGHSPLGPTKAETWGPFLTSPLAPRGEICHLGGMFTPSFASGGKHSLLFRRMVGRTENFTLQGITSPPGYKIHYWGTTSSLGSKFAPRSEVKNWPLSAGPKFCRIPLCIKCINLGKKICWTEDHDQTASSLSLKSHFQTLDLLVNTIDPFNITTGLSTSFWTMYSIFLAFDQVQKMVFGYHYKKGTKYLFFFQKEERHSTKISHRETDSVSENEEAQVRFKISAVDVTKIVNRLTICVTDCYISLFRSVLHKPSLHVSLFNRRQSLKPNTTP